MKSRLLRFSVLATTMLGAPIAFPHDQAAHADHDHVEPLGNVQFPVSCSKEAQRRSGTRARIARGHAQVRPHRAAQPACAAHPTHIHTRMGDWDGSIRGNLAAAQAALENAGGRSGTVRMGRISARRRVPRLRPFCRRARTTQRSRRSIDSGIRRRSSRASRPRSISLRHRRATRSNDANGAGRRRWYRACLPRSTGIASAGPRRSRALRAALALRTCNT